MIYIKFTEINNFISAHGFNILIYRVCNLLDKEFEKISNMPYQHGLSSEFCLILNSTVEFLLSYGKTVLLKYLKI